MEGKEYDDWIGFGTRLKNARNSIGMTVEKLAEKANRTENFILRIESGKKACSIHTLHQLCKAMNISADSLLYGDNRTQNDSYEDKDIIVNIINNCNANELKIIKDVLVAVSPNFENLKK